MDQCKPSRTPADLNLKLQTAQNGDEEVDQRIYRSLVGSLLYLAKQTRPDIMFTVNILSRHMNAPTNQHWMCGKRLLRHLQGSKGLKFTYTEEASYDLVGESDADWSGDKNDRKSTTGELLLQAQRTWRSTQLGCQEAGHSCSFFIRSRISGHGSSSSGSTLPETTSRGFWHPTETSNSNWRGQPKLYQTLPNPVMHKRSKHIETKFHFIRDKTEDGTISIQYVPTDKMAADIFTKSLPVSKVETFRAVLMGADSTQSAQD